VVVQRLKASPSYEMTHRDQIHGDVRFDPLAVALLNTEALQRLGRVYQLGYAHLIYRGGTHTRLSHVMGAMHVAGRLVDLLRENYVETTDLPRGAIKPDEFLPTGTSKGTADVRWDALRHLVRWAALLHDVGHVPLGHTLEDEFDGIYVKHDHFSSPRIPYLWYELSPGLDSEIRQVFRTRDDLLPSSFRVLGLDGEQAWQAVMLICLHKEDVKDGRRTSFRDLLDAEDETSIPFVRILKAAMKNTERKAFFPYMADIVGNTICADYLDYLRRDPINVGLDVLRDDRVASRFFVGQDVNGLPRMALSLVDKHGKPRLDTCTGVVELVRQRYRFAEIIYYHKTKVAASVMLAKVFILIGKPEEVGPASTLIEIDHVTNLAHDVLSNGPAHVEILRKQCYPAALLSPDIGDETLLLWLQDRGWDAVEEARQGKDLQKVARCLRGLSLLQALVRRSLYKVCLTIDRKIYEEIDPGTKVDTEVERRIHETLQSLRKEDTTRTDLETKMAAAAGWPEDSLLLYVPPRKSQAKGIETGALDRGEVVTLGNHPAVSKEVSSLGEAYKSLWRIILLVHPKYSSDAIGMSRAVDALVKGLWPLIDVSTASQALGEAAWFSYIPEKQRAAATMYRDLVASDIPDWTCFQRASRDTTDGTVSSEEHALRAVLLSKVASAGGSAYTVKHGFGNPNSLLGRVGELEAQLSIEGREGISDPRERRLAAIERIAAELLQGPQKRLFQ
jgi:HD superfamily phosphohydrolase